MLARTVGAAAAMVVARRDGRESLLSRGPQDADRAIWDGHVHLTSGPGGVEDRIDWLLQHADRMGIERMVVSMGTAFAEDPSPDELRKANDEVLAAIAHAPRRVMGFVYVNPKHPRGEPPRDGPLRARTARWWA